MDWLLDAIDKSLLLLFFRKEVLFYVFSFSPYLGSYQKRTAFLDYPLPTEARPGAVADDDMVVQHDRNGLQCLRHLARHDDIIV